MIGNRTSVSVSQKNLQHNVLSLRSLLPTGTHAMAVVKSNAYGHGLLYTAWSVAPHVEWFAVDDLEEAKILRQHGIKHPILILGYVPEEWYQTARSLDCTLTASNLLSLKWAINHGVSVHIKLDTGLGRQGFVEKYDMDELVRLLARRKPSEITGVYTHFAVADDPLRDEFTHEQIDRFDRMRTRVEEALGRHLLAHTSGSSGALRGDPTFARDMVRLGVSMYGIWPSSELHNHLPERDLMPAMTWTARIAEIKRLPRGHSIGYERTHVLRRDSIIAVVPIGYWHGIPRTASNRAMFALGDRLVPVIGNVSMDMCVVDITEVSASYMVGDTIEIIGPNNPPSELARQIGMSVYELVTRINPMIDRRLV